MRAEDAKLCALTVFGVDEKGHKQLLAIEDGVRESTLSWREVLLKLEQRGMNVPKLGLGDGALGFRGAADQVFHGMRHQHCWTHKTANVLKKLPKSAQPKAKQVLHEIWMAETKKNDEAALDLL